MKGVREQMTEADKKVVYKTDHEAMEAFYDGLKKAENEESINDRE